jgi:hypothetical protein
VESGLVDDNLRCSGLQCRVAGVPSGEGMITHHHRRVSKERARDRHALLLPAAQ